MDPVSDDKMYSAKPAMIVVFALALVAALGGWFYSTGLQRRPIQFWGADRAALIVRAPIVELLTLVPNDSGTTPDNGQTLKIDDRTWDVSSVKDISRVNGLKNVRSALINDYSFDWDVAVDRSQVAWTNGLRFRDQSREITVVFAPEQAAAYSPQTGQTHSIAPAMVGISRFLDDAKGREPR